MGRLSFKNPIGDAVSRVRFAPRSNHLLVSSWDSSLRLYDVDGALLRLEAASDAALLDCCFRDDSEALSAASNGAIERHDLHSGTKDIVGSHDDLATCVEYSHEVSQVISSGFDKKLISWDMRSANTAVCVTHTEKDVESMSLSGHDLTVAAGASIYIYDLRNMRTTIQANGLLKEVQIRCLTSIPYCRGYAVGSVDGRVALNILDQSKFEGTGYAFRCHPKTKDGTKYFVTVNDIVFNPVISGNFVTGNNDGYVTIWNAHSRRRLFEFPRYPNSVASLSYNRTGNLLAVAASYTYQEANELEAHPQIFVEEVDNSYAGSSSALSLNGKRLNHADEGCSS